MYTSAGQRLAGSISTTSAPSKRRRRAARASARAVSSRSASSASSGEQVPVDVERRRDRRVTEPGLDRLRVRALGDRERRARMPQVVERGRGFERNRTHRRSPEAATEVRPPERSAGRRGEDDVPVRNDPARCRPSSSARNAGIVITRRDAFVFNGPTYNLPLTSAAPE
jgi:hypothetical protein